MKPKFLYLFIAAIAGVFFSSCTRYDQGTSFADVEADFPSIQWKQPLSDTVRNSIIQYAVVMGKDFRPDISQLIVHTYYGILTVPDTIIKDVPLYLSVLRFGSPMIAKREFKRISGPSLWEAPKTRFTLLIIDPVMFTQATVIKETRDVVIFWQWVLIIVSLIFFLWILSADDIEGYVTASTITLILMYLSVIGLSYMLSVLLILTYTGIHGFRAWTTYLKKKKKRQQTMWCIDVSKERRICRSFFYVQYFLFSSYCIDDI